jgi:hypothetical protein
MKTIEIMRSLNFHNEKQLVWEIRIIIDCMTVLARNVIINLCSEFEYLAVSTFMDLIIKLIIYHKNEHCQIESFQYKHGKAYVIKVSILDLYRTTNRYLILFEHEINTVKEMGLTSLEIFKTFQISFNNRQSLKDKLLNMIYYFTECLIVSSNVECKIILDKFSKKYLIPGINRVKRINGSLKGGIIIPIYFII